MAQPRIAGPNRQRSYMLAYDHAQVTADTTIKLDKIPTGQTLRIDSVQYINVTGLAEDASAFYAIKVLNGASTVAASISTDAAGAGDNSIVANTFTDLTLSTTDADAVVAAGAVLSLFLDRGAAAATLPAGRIVIRGRYV